mmetsp:Transcript_86254/g.252286  ORF Transcript_86254/g.252286 Transcript_86254/m.252286 type:complete len:363 (+) Transcript_86254:102-1190(+)
MVPALQCSLGVLWCVCLAAGHRGLEDGESLMQAALATPDPVITATSEWTGTRRKDAGAVPADKPAFASVEPSQPLALLDVAHVHDPRPVPVDTMRSIVPAEKNMLEYKVGSDMIIYGFNATKDRSISAALARGELWEGSLSDEFCQFLKAVKGPADFVDVGANIGTWTVPLARCLRAHGQGGKVVAVEGVPLIAEYLEASVVRNNLTDIVDVYSYVAGSETVVSGGVVGESPDNVTISLHPTNKGASSILHRGRASSSVRASMTTVDAILSRYSPRVLGIKLDVEGYEGHVLKGARRLLENPPCLLSIEVNSLWLESAGTPESEVLGLLRSAGYNVPRVAGGPQFTDTFLQADLGRCLARFQ